MAQVPPHFAYVPKPQQGPAPPQHKEPRFRFRWELLLILLVIFIVLYLMKGAETSFSFEDIMDLLGVEDRDRYIRLFTLGCICVAITAIIRIHSSRTKGQK